MKARLWPYWVTGIFWVMVLGASIINSYLQLQGLKNVSAGGSEVGLYPIAIFGIVGAVGRLHGVSFGVSVILFSGGIILWLLNILSGSRIPLGMMPVIAVVFGLINLIALRGTNTNDHQIDL